MVCHLRWLSLVITTLAFCDFATAQEAASHDAAESERSIADQSAASQWIADLGHDQYLRREKASRKLIQIGTPAIEPMIAAMRSGDLEVIERVIDIITEIGFSRPPSDDGGAWNQLTLIASQGTGQKASRARVALAEIRSQRALQARDALKAAGITVAIDKISQYSSIQQRMVVTVGDDWNADLDSLQWLRWLDGIENACVTGKSASPSVVEQIVTMPDLKSVSFVDTTIDQESIAPLMQLKRIDMLEFRYVELKDQYADLLVQLPMRQSLELMGTGMSKEVVETMQQKLPGLQITHRQGGFLGVQCSPTDKVCQITSVLPNSAAKKAGLLPGDVIIHVGKSEIREFVDLQQEINRHIPGDQIEVKLRRGGQVKTLQLELGRFENL